MTTLHVTRRSFLSSALLLPTLFTETSNARFLATVPLGTPGGAAAPPFGRLLGSGLDARLFTDLTRLGGSAGNRESVARTPPSASGSSSASLVTPNDRFFVRTAS